MLREQLRWRLGHLDDLCIAPDKSEPGAIVLAPHAADEGNVDVNGLPRRLLLIAWAANIVILALPLPFDNLLPAWAILFFCLALIEDDGVMAMLGWLFSVLTALWTIFLLMIGHAAVMAVVVAIKSALFD